MKNILHLTETSEPGGSETVLAYIAKHLDPKHYRSSVCLLNEGWLSGHLKKIGVDYTIIENKRSFDPIFLSQLTRLIKRERIDLVHTHEFGMNVYGSIAARVCFVPMIGTIHSRLYFTEKKRRMLAYKLAIALCSQMVTVCEDLRMFMHEKLRLRNANKIVTIYNGIDLEKYAIKSSFGKLCSQLSIPAGTLVAGTVGSLFKVKGIPYLLEATKKVVSHFPNFRLLIAGEGDQESVLKQKTLSLGLEQTVSFLGFRNDIPELLNLFDIYICSSISEGLSLSILEAMAAGKPVVATQVGGNPELVIPGKNGFLVSPGDPYALAEKILILLKDKNLRELMGRTGKKIAEEKFSLEKMVKNYQNLYEKLLV